MKSKLQSTISELPYLERNRDSEERIRALARGMARLFDSAMSLLQEALKAGEFKLKIRTILLLHREAYCEVDSEAGTLRRDSVKITNSSYVPPNASLLPIFLEEMCDYVNDNWKFRSALHLSAYVLWRLLWIHPFNEGNGAIARTLSYVVLMARQGQFLPGRKTIPEQIAANRSQYYEALEKADAAWAEGKLDVSALEKLLGKMLEEQLAS